MTIKYFTRSRAAPYNAIKLRIILHKEQGL